MYVVVAVPTELERRLCEFERSFLQKVVFAQHPRAGRLVSEKEKEATVTLSSFEATFSASEPFDTFNETFCRISAHLYAQFTPTQIASHNCLKELKATAFASFDDDEKVHEYASKFKEALHRAAAVLIEDRSPSRNSLRLARLLSFAPLHALEINKFELARRFIEVAVSCWCWILNCRADLRIMLLANIFDAWQSTVDKRLGVYVDPQDEFQELHLRANPLNYPGGANIELKRHIRFSHLHATWTKFLEEELVIAKSTSGDAVYLFAEFLTFALPSPNGHMYMVPQRTIENNVAPTLMASNGTYLSRQRHSKIISNVSAIEVRFRLLKMGFSLLHSNQLKAHHSDQLRETLYANAFDYFSAPPHYPSQTTPQLRETIDTLLRFYQTVNDDKRQITSRQPSDTVIFPRGSVRGARTRRRNDSFFDLQQSVPDSSHMKRQHLLVALLTDELDRLFVWYNPVNSADLQLKDPQIQVIIDKRSKLENLPVHYVRLAWRINPLLALYLCDRFPHANVVNELRHLIASNSIRVLHCDAALPHIATNKNLAAHNRGSLQLGSLLYAANVSPAIAIGYLFPRITVQNVVLIQYALRVFEQCSNEVLIFYAPQLVQALRYDTLCFVRQLLVGLARRSQLFAHQILWNMQTNALHYNDKLSITTPDSKLLPQVLVQFVQQY